MPALVLLPICLIAADDDKESLMELEALELLGLDDRQVEKLLDNEALIQQRLNVFMP